MHSLLSPAKLHTLTLKNRIVRSATWTGTATAAGEVTAESIDLLVECARGGVGLIVTGHAYVQPRGHASLRQLAVYSDRFVDGLKRMVDQVHEAFGVVALQLAHAGVNAIEGTEQSPWCVSPVDGVERQQELSVSDIEQLAADFVSAGVRARDAGFDAVMLHSGHGYLLSQFLSPAFNKREDAYGGDVEGRSRIHCEILQALRSELGEDFPLLVKMNGNDYVEGGLNPADAATAARLMEAAGCNAVELSGGILRNVKYSPSRMGISSEKKEAYFREDARIVKSAISIPLILVGGLRSLSVMESVLDNGDADFISLSRPLICEPDLVTRWQSGDRTPSRCKSDNRCFKSGFEGRGVSCPHRDKL